MEVDPSKILFDVRGFFGRKYRRRGNDAVDSRLPPLFLRAHMQLTDINRFPPHFQSDMTESLSEAPTFTALPSQSTANSP